MEHDEGNGSDAGNDTEVGAGTGDTRVDAAVEALGDLDAVPVSEHPAIFERIHGQLVEVLGELHPGPDPSGRDPSGSG
jgi:hypothetical protein